MSKNKLLITALIGLNINTALFAIDNNNTKVSGEITNYQAALNVAIAHKNEIFINKLNNIFSYIEDYILQTGDIDNINIDKIKDYFGLKDDNLFKNFDGKENITISVRDDGILFGNLYDETPADNELYFLQNAPNFSPLMKLYKDANGNYFLFIPFNKTTLNFIHLVQEAKLNVITIPDKDYSIENVVVSNDTPADSPKTLWLKPDGNGDFIVYYEEDGSTHFDKIGKILNNGNYIPFSEKAIISTQDKTDANNMFVIDENNIKTSIVENLNEVNKDNLAEGSILINSDENNIDSVYMKIGNDLQPIAKEDFSSFSNEIQGKIMQAYLNSNAAIYLVFNKENYNERSKTFSTKGIYNFSPFIAKGISFLKDDITGKKYAFLYGGANSYIRGIDAVKVFGYIQKAQHKKGATFTMIAVFRNATQNIRDPKTGEQLYNDKQMQVPFGVSGYPIGLYYAWLNICYGCYLGDYTYIARYSLFPGKIYRLDLRGVYPSKITNWMIAVWQYQRVNKYRDIGIFKFFEVEKGKAKKLYEKTFLDTSDSYYIGGKKYYDPNEDYIAFGGGIHFLGEYDGIGGGADTYSPGVIANGNGAGFRGWVGALTIIPDVISDNQIIQIVKYEMPNLIKE